MTERNENEERKRSLLGSIVSGNESNRGYKWKSSENVNNGSNELRKSVMAFHDK
jgi:hypothetical protein